MDQKEFHLQPMGICYRLYHFLTKSLASQALKTVTLGCSRHHSSSSAAPRGAGSKAKKGAQLETQNKVDDKKLPPTEGLVANEKNNPCMNVGKMEGENEALTLPTASLAPTRSIKKTVSINEKVEEIPPPKKLKRKGSKSSQKSFSTDQDEDPPTHPPRSILKVGSDLNDKSNSIS